jgi:hypothetical protein
MLKMKYENQKIPSLLELIGESSINKREGKG